MADKASRCLSRVRASHWSVQVCTSVCLRFFGLTEAWSVVIFAKQVQPIAFIRMMSSSSLMTDDHLLI